MKKVSFQNDDKIVELAAGKVQSQALGGKRQAFGDITFTGQPAANDTFTLNGVVFTAVAAAPTGNQFLIGASETLSITALETVIQTASTAEAAAIAAGLETFPVTEVTPQLTLATYSNVGGTKLHVEAVYGAIGNTFTLAESCANATVSGATLTGGSDADHLSLDAETKALSTITGTTVTEFDLPAGEEGQETTLYLASLGAGSNAQVNGTFAGPHSHLTFSAVGQLAKLKWLGASWSVIANTGTFS